MGAVFKAEHRVMERLVALKVIHNKFVDNPQAVERFTREVKAAARLNHPNIVAAFDAEQAGGRHFLVMEFVDGISLDRYVAQQGPLAPIAAARLTRQAALALDHAHQRGMVHRDIKPQNLMLRRGGQLKVLDFGLARLASSPIAGPIAGQFAGPLAAKSPRETSFDPAGNAVDEFAAQRTMTGMLLGTPDYLAPEQARDPRSADIRADIYSLGCTLFYLLRGAAPFAKMPLRETLTAHAVADRRPLIGSLSHVPINLRGVLGKMLAADPADRYQTPAQLAKALAKVIAELESSANAAPTAGPDPANVGHIRETQNPQATGNANEPAGHGAGGLTVDLASIDDTWVQQAPPLFVPGQDEKADAKHGFAHGRSMARWATGLLAFVFDRPRSNAARSNAARLAAAGVLAAVVVGLVVAAMSWGWMGGRGGDAAAPTSDQVAASNAENAVAAALPSVLRGDSGRGMTDGGGAVTSDAGSTRRTWKYELPENIAGRRLVLFVLPKRDLWMPDYGPLRGRLEREGRVKVVTASTETGPCAIHERSPGQDERVEADVVLSPHLLTQRDFSAVIFVGYDTDAFVRGSHATAAKQVIKGMAAQGKLVGAICVGQSVLAEHRVLAGREAAWGKFLEGRVTNDQARWRTDARVVVDRAGSFPVVTAAADGDAVPFAEAILQWFEEY
jgi:serine/threonine protein kinase/putative intracellular protease/amidase